VKGDHATFSEKLLAAAKPVWEATVEHPFVEEMAAGALPREKFDRWIQQDFRFVSAFRRFVALILSKTEDDDVHTHLREFLVAIETELDLFRAYASENDVPQGYADFLLTRAALGTFEEAFTALFAAEKAYFDAWRTVRERSGLRGDYATWIDNWSSDGFAEWVDWLASSLDRLTAQLSQQERDALQNTFLMVARYEYLFWNAVYKGDNWQPLNPDR
jgi:thiaminase/transcriptional activator TenA